MTGEMPRRPAVVNKHLWKCLFRKSHPNLII